MNNTASKLFNRNFELPQSIPTSVSTEKKKKSSSFYDDYLQKSSTNNTQQTGSPLLTRSALKIEELMPQTTQPASPSPKVSGSAIKKNIQGVLSKKYGELDTRNLFDGIDDKDVEDNIETAESTIKTNLDRGALNKSTLPKLPNLRDGLALSYAAANKGKSKAATKAREAAYMKFDEPLVKDTGMRLFSTGVPMTQNTNTANVLNNQTAKNHSFYNDFIQTNKITQDKVKSYNKLGKKYDLPKDSKNPRYVRADILNMRSAPGLGSKVIGGLLDGTEVHYTGNKTEEIDGHLWAEVTHDGKTGWVAADYLKIAKPQSLSSGDYQNSSGSASAMSQKPSQSVSVGSANKESKIDINDYSALQDAFNKVRKPGATDGDFGEPGDFDGVEGLECPDVSKWFVTNFTTLNAVKGDGKNQVANLAKENGLDVSAIPCAPAIFSVAGRCSGPGTSGVSDGNCGHTGVILSCELTEKGDYILTYFHTYSGLLAKGETSAITTKTFTKEQLKNTTFLDLKNHMTRYN